jgi:hypothetical protein
VVIAALLQQLHAFEHVDSNYHRYEIIRCLRTRTELVDGGASLADETSCLRQQLESAVEMAIATMARDGIGVLEGREEQGMERRCQDSEILVFDDSDEDAAFRDFGFSSELPAYHLLPPLLERLTGDCDLAGRREAFDELRRTFQPGDLLASPHWKQIREAVTRALSEPANADDIQAIEFVAALFEAALPEAQCTELYLSLCSHVKECFLEVPARGHLTTMLRRVRLLNQFQIKLAEHWLYYPRHVVSNLVTATVDVLALKTAAGIESEAALSPLHLLAVVDPTALWFRTWSRHVAARHLFVDALVKCAEDGVDLATHLFSRASLLHEKLPTWLAENGTAISTPASPCL